MVSASGCRMCRGPSRGLAQSSCTPLPLRCAAGSIEMGDGRWAVAMGGRGGGRRCVRCDAWVPPAGRGGGGGRGRDAALHLHLHLQLHQRSLAPGSGLWQQIPAKVGQALDASALARESKAKTKLTPTSTQHLFSFLQRLKPPLFDCTVPSTSTVRQQSCLSERSTATA